MNIKNKIVLATFMVATSGVFASEFYVFPIREIEGMNFNNKANDARTMVDKRSVDIFTPDAQKQIIGSFISNLSKAYPSSILHSSQVRDTVKGKYQYQAGGVACGESFVAPVNKSYAVVAGVTRASYYEVDKGESLEILVPITMNIQLIKPERAKIVYTASSTLYTPFTISKRELGLPATKEFMTKSLTANTINQINELVDVIKKNFDPKESIVKVIDKSDGFVVVNKGYEVGFKSGDELEARPKSSPDGSPIIFKVLSVDSGYSVLKPLMGSPSSGDEFIFVFESPADDSRKPKLMPVYSADKDQQWSGAVADLFAKDIGFKAPFQLAPVDVNFNDTMNSVRAQANCVPWDKFPSAKTVFDSRLDHPNFFLKFEMAQSPVFVNAGKAKSEESFMTALSAQVVDKDGNIIFSEFGTDAYMLERVGKQGLSLPNAREISMKNSLIDLMKNFLANVKLEPKQFLITDAQKGKFSVKGLEVPAGQNIVYEVLKPLGVNVPNGKAMMRVAVDQDTNLPVSADGKTSFTYSQVPDYPEVKSGDILSVVTMPKGNLPEISACEGVFVGKDSLKGDYLVPFIQQIAYKSQIYQVSVSNKDFYEDTNKLLGAGFYKFRLPKATPTEFCYKPGYLIRKNEVTCGSDGCGVKFLTAMKVTTEKNGVEVKDTSFGEQTSVNGIAEKEVDNLIGYRAMLSARNLMGELVKRFNTK